MDEITQLPTIVLGDPIGDIRCLVPEVAQMIADGHKAFNHGGVAATMSNGVLTVLNKAELVALIVDVADIVKPDKNGLTIPAIPNPHFLGALFERLPGHLPEIKGFAPHPVWRDGDILQAGWHDGLLVSSEPIDVEAWTDPAAAYNWLLDEWLLDFPFHEEVDKANAIALACTMLVSPTHLAGEEGPPAFSITATRHNAGKTFLPTIIMEAIAGRCSTTTYPKGEELIKVLTTLVLAGKPYVIFDNLPRGWRVGDARLEHFVTATDYENRILGANKEINAPANVVVIVAGNQIEVTKDMRSRTLVVNLQPKADINLARRTYHHTDLRAFTRTNRGKILGALSAVLSAKAKGGLSGRFTAWNQVVAGPIVTLAQTDITEWWKDVGDDGEQSEYAEAMPGILAAIHAMPTPETVADINGNWFTAAEILEGKVIGDARKHSVHVYSAQSMTSFLRKEVGINYDGFALQTTFRSLGNRTNHKKRNLFKVEKLKVKTSAQK
ncbi:MAG: hypothetical protein ABJR23_05340 [Paracoccaceae bacterium]